MPTYQYRCASCGHNFEEFQAITDDPIEVCPECSEKAYRIISGGAGFLFKGSGFYVTDYRSKKYKADAARDGTSSSSSGSSSSSSSDSSKKSSSDKPSSTKD